jgi:hypothetical protein
MLINDLPILPVAFFLEVVIGNESKCSRVDAVTQAPVFDGAVVEDMAEMAVSLGGTNLGPNHPVTAVYSFHDILGL